MTSVANFLTSRQGTLALRAGSCAVTLGYFYYAYQCYQNGLDEEAWKNNAVTTVVTPLLCGLAYYGLNLCENVIEKIRNAQVLDPDEFAYRILRREHRTQLEQETLTKALDRIKNDFPKEYSEFTRWHIFYTSSEEGIIAFFEDQLNDGCCAGTANAIFNQICCGSSTSMLESIPMIQSEDVVYGQILEILKGSFWTSKKNIKNRHLSLNFEDSERFPKESRITAYREIFERIMHRFPDDQNVIGVVHIPHHVICIQYGPRGYFLYDPFGEKKGLFEYVDSDTFFSQLKKHVLYDVKIIIELKAPQKFQENQRSLLEEKGIYYSIRPLHHINPLLEARELPSEGWRTWINQTYNSFTHRLALTALPPIEEEMPSSVKAYVDVNVELGNILGIRADGDWEMTIPFEWTQAGWMGELPLGKEFKFVKALGDGSVQWESLKGNRILEDLSPEGMALGANVNVDVGFGNILGIRVDRAWETTIPFEWTPAGWKGELPLNTGFKFVKVLEMVMCNGNVKKGTAS